MVMRLIGIVILLVLSAAAMGVTATEELGDLSLESLRVSPVAVDRGGTVSISFDIGVVESYPSVVVQLTCRRADLESDCLLERKTVLLDEPGPVSGEFTIDTQGLVPGEYEITVRLDPDNSLSEISKANNRVAAVLTVRAPLPDLVPTFLGVQPRSPVDAGSTVSFTARIANTGSASAAAFRVVCEILALDGSWMAIGAVEFAGLERDRELDVSFPYAVSREGEYGLRVRVELLQPADPHRGVRERDEANNTLETSFLVLPTDRRMPDLRPISFSLSPASPLEWQANATATVTIVNTGGAATEDGVQVAFQYRRVGSGDAGWQDLKDPDVLKDEGGSACDPSNWQWAVRPVHSQAASLSIEEGRNTRVLSVPIDFAAHQRSRPCNGQTLPARILPGDYELKVIVDPLGRISEQDKRNNELIIGFSILGSELQAEALELSRSSVERGTDVVVKATVRNTGAKTAEAFSVGFFVGATRMDTFHYAGSGLADEDTVTVQGVLRTHDLAEGQHLVRVVIDPDGQLYEGDKSNNTISAPLEVLGLPQRQAELFVDRIVFSPPTPVSPGQTFFVRAAVNNAGDLAAERFNVVLRVASTGGSVTTVALDLEEDQRVELVQAVDRLAPLQTMWLEWPVIGLTEGLYIAQILVDPASAELPQGRVLERDETNNSLLTGFSVLDLADAPGISSGKANLVCQGLVISPSAVTTGTPVTVRAVVTNAGNEPAGACEVEWLWVYPTGQSQRLETERIGPLGAGASIELSRTIDARSFPHGIHQLVLRVDIGNEVDESSTVDNVCSASVAIGTTVVDPRVDLLPIGVRFDSPGAVIGENNTVEQNQRLFTYVTIRNQGNVASGPFHVAFTTRLGEGREAWTSVGALDQSEVSHRLPTSVPGEYSLTIEVDPDALLLEENRSNNTITATYTVIPSTVTIEEVVPPTGVPARWLATQGVDDRVYAAWTDGTIRSLGAGVVQEVATIPGSVTAVAWSLGTVPTAYVGTTDGSFYVVRLESGTVQGPVALGSPVVELDPAGTGRVYAAVQGGLQELLLSATEVTAGLKVPVAGDVLGVRYIADRSTVYVLSTEGLFGYDASGIRLCHLDAAELVGTPTAFTVSGTGVYVGTTAGTGSVVYAVSHCTPTVDGRGQMLSAWRSPRVGTMPGTITSLVVDPREVDPVYVATSDGVLRSLSLDGALQWSFETEAPVRSTPVADRRTGRIFFGNDSGTPYVLTMDGVEAFEIDRQHGAGHSIASTLVIVETRQRTVFGTQLVRNYYYGTESGAIYRIVARQ